MKVSAVQPDVAAAPSASGWALLGATRFVLAGIVMAAHLGFVAPGLTGPGINYVNSFGSANAVMAFFILSGFSIAHSITVKPVGYLRRRFLRIYPCYLFCLLVGMLPYWIFGAVVASGVGPIRNPGLWPNLVPDLLLLQSLGWGVIGFTGPSWSLSVEWLLYIAAIWLVRASDKVVWLLTLVSAGAFVLARFIPSLSKPAYWELGGGAIILLCAWAWLAGFLYYRNRQSPVSAVVLLGGCVGVINLSDAPALAPHGVATIAVTCALIKLSEYVNFSGRGIGLLNYLGDLSYPLYLCHIAVMLCIYNGTHSISVPLYLSAAVVASAIIYHVIDKPLRRFGVAARPKVGALHAT